MAEPLITVQKLLFPDMPPPLNHWYDVHTPAECIAHSQHNAERRLRAQRAKEYGTELEADISMQEPQEQEVRLPISNCIEQSDEVSSEMPGEPAPAAQTEEEMDGDMDCNSDFFRERNSAVDSRTPLRAMMLSRPNVECYPPRVLSPPKTVLCF
eukprot:3940721-Rhodomonas_salina.5